VTSNIIKFIHEERIIEIRNPDPNETLLNFIRTKLRKTGTKEIRVIICPWERETNMEQSGYDCLLCNAS